MGIWICDPFSTCPIAKTRSHGATVRSDLCKSVGVRRNHFGRTCAGAQSSGLCRTPVGPRLELCREIKAIFDPAGIMNPGKFLSATPQLVNEFLRSVPMPAPASVIADDRDAANGSGLPDDSEVLATEGLSIDLSDNAANESSTSPVSMKQVVLPLFAGLDWQRVDFASHAQLQWMRSVPHERRR